LTTSAAVILVVDDESGVVRLCQRLLERVGFQVIAVTRPQEGLAVLDRSLVDLLLIDIRMPEMSGFNMIELAREKQPELAVVVMTGFGTVETAIEALRRGADGLILKPFAEGSELVESVRVALEGNQHKRDLMRFRALRPLFDLSEVLFSETDPNHLINLVLEAISDHLNCPHAGLYRREAGETGLKLVANIGKALSAENSYPEGGPLGRADAEGMPLRINRHGQIDASLRSILEVLDMESLMCAPVSLESSNTVFMAARNRGDKAFSQADLEMFVILARQAALALENARLYAELRAYIHQLEESRQVLLKAEKMAAAGRMTASIAHEINNPLQAVHNCLHLAKRKELSSEQREHYLELAQSEMDRLMSTVQRMLDFYRPGALDRKPTDVNKLVERVLMLLGQQMEKQGVRVRTKLDTGLAKAMIVGDQIQQVLLNLVLNGLEAMPGGGELYIETQPGRGEVMITFEDTGPGVPEEERDRIFEPFLSTKEGGTGLGLTVSYGIVAAHGGHLELLPNVRQGARFRVTLPSGDMP
jgi:two-component system, NtrC family, sensor kinase